MSNISLAALLEQSGRGQKPLSKSELNNRVNKLANDLAIAASTSNRDFIQDGSPVTSLKVGDKILFNNNQKTNFTVGTILSMERDQYRWYFEVSLDYIYETSTKTTSKLKKSKYVAGPRNIDIISKFELKG